MEVNKISKNKLMQLKEDNLMFITNPGRMGDVDGSTFVIKNNDNYKMYRVGGWYSGTKDESSITLEDMFKQFPKWKEAWDNIPNDEYEGKYIFISMGFGNGLCVDKTIYDTYYPYLIKHIKENGGKIDNDNNYDHALNMNAWLDALIDMVLDETDKLPKVNGFDDRNIDFQLYKIQRDHLKEKRISDTAEIEIPDFLKHD